jgi:hypothetical protein
MEGRKNFLKSKYWRGYVAQKLRCDVKLLTLTSRSMILADALSDCHMCPVSLFVALAIADGAFEGIMSSDDFLSLGALDWSGYITVPYKQETGRRPVLRRTGNKSNTISPCAMKPSTLYKMI